jgi:hypothetical protein
MKTFLAIDPESHEVAYTHSGEAFKKPAIVDGNLHWYSYAPDALIERVERRNLDKIIVGYFDEWCSKHGFITQQPTIMEALLENYNVIEFQFVAPIIKEGVM